VPGPRFELGTILKIVNFQYHIDTKKPFFGVNFLTNIPYPFNKNGCAG